LGRAGFLVSSVVLFGSCSRLFGYPSVFATDFHLFNIVFKLVTDGACLTNVTVDTRLLRATMYISVMCSVIMHNILLSEFFL